MAGREYLKDIDGFHDDKGARGWVVAHEERECPAITRVRDQRHRRRDHLRIGLSICWSGVNVSVNVSVNRSLSSILVATIASVLLPPFIRNLGLLPGASSPPATPPPSTSSNSHARTTTTTTTASASSTTASTQRQIDEARNAVVASIGNMVDRELAGRAALLHANKAAIERQERDVARTLDGFRRDNDRLARLADEHTRKVKEIGNVQNWAEMLERDFLIMEETLRLVREGEGEGGGGSGDERSWSGSYSGSGSERSWEGSEDGNEGRRDGEGDVVMGDDEQEEESLTASTPVDKGKGREVDKAEADLTSVGVQGEAPSSGVVVLEASAIPELVPLPESPPPGIALGVNEPGSKSAAA
ncbi:hypothetical protein B0T17DRAFT_611984 [Bombardia bombarda]|uniref:Biogenesis of lysosome-related organelles complex 1 subunit 1 n=1 Tax=Bombardia bombarda TaxID=252184 RepID=A0AA39XJH7_9PEZI|nr:hypothetical protein B0T17DRAFT_611984 [Bombardia bombarda]